MKKYARYVGGGVLCLSVLYAMNPRHSTVSASEGDTSEADKTHIVQTERDGGKSSRFFRFAASNIPHVEKRDKGGEDAWVASDNLLVVADGVGGWASRGIDSGLFSKKLVSDIKDIFEANNAQELKQVLVDAVRLNKHTGSSTCVLAKFDTSRDNFLKTTNLGDSGYLLLRPDENGEVTKLFRSKEQQYSFNFPYQCGTGADLPYDAFDTEHEIQDDDIVVMASDGVFDNLYDEDIIDCVTPNLQKQKLQKIQASSDCIANKSELYGNRRNYLSPFAKNALEHHKRYPHQGKADDVTVICAQIHTKPTDTIYYPQVMSTNGPIYHMSDEMHEALSRHHREVHEREVQAAEGPGEGQGGQGRHDDL